jgi:hypothetical protein
MFKNELAVRVVRNEVCTIAGALFLFWEDLSPARQCRLRFARRAQALWHREM